MAVSAFSNKHRHMISTVILILIQTIIFYLRFKRFPVLFPGSVPVLESISPKRFLCQDTHNAHSRQISLRAGYSLFKVHEVFLTNVFI